MGINQYIQIGSKIKDARLSKHISQKDMAERLGLSVSTYSNYENNYREPKLETIEKICEILGITIEELMNTPEYDPEKHAARFYPTGGKQMPTKPFTMPRQDRTEQEAAELKFRTNDGVYDYERLDELEYNGIILKLGRGVELSPQEIRFKAAYEERELKKIGNIFAKFYTLLNEQGRKKADEQIARALEAIELLTKVPEYQKKQDD